MAWTETNIPNLNNKTIVVTGANSGIGFEAVKLFAKNGAEVVMACRSTERGQRAFDDIKAEHPQASLTLMSLDLASFQSIRAFSKQLHERFQKIDILLNNAGIMMTPFGVTVDGIEQQQAVNHFGHFLLTSLVFDLIKNADQPRIVNIASIAHKYGKMNFDNLFYQNGKGYNSMTAYGRSKLENLLFTYELARRVEAAGLDIKVLAAHPGVATTNLGSRIHAKWYYKVFKVFTSSLSQDAYMGSLPGVRAAVDPDAQNGTYYGPDGFNEMKGNPVVVSSNKRSHDKDAQARLWTLSEQLTNSTFQI